MPHNIKKNGPGFKQYSFGNDRPNCLLVDGKAFPKTFSIICSPAKK
jgi:hypothetical protein